jgi:hypothetical protein
LVAQEDNRQISPITQMNKQGRVHAKTPSREVEARQNRFLCAFASLREQSGTKRAKSGQRFAAPSV